MRITGEAVAKEQTDFDSQAIERDNIEDLECGGEDLTRNQGQTPGEGVVKDSVAERRVPLHTPGASPHADTIGGTSSLKNATEPDRDTGILTERFHLGKFRRENNECEVEDLDTKQGHTPGEGVVKDSAAKWRVPLPEPGAISHDDTTDDQRPLERATGSENSTGSQDGVHAKERGVPPPQFHCR